MRVLIILIVWLSGCTAAWASPKVTVATVATNAVPHYPITLASGNAARLSMPCASYVSTSAPEHNGNHLATGASIDETDDESEDNDCKTLVSAKVPDAVNYFRCFFLNLRSQGAPPSMQLNRYCKHFSYTGCNQHINLRVMRI